MLSPVVSPCTYSPILQVPCSSHSPSLPLCTLSPHPLVRGESEYNRVNHSYSEAVALSIHSTVRAWNTLPSSTYLHTANTRRARRHTTPTQLHTHFPCQSASLGDNETRNGLNMNSRVSIPQSSVWDKWIHWNFNPFDQKWIVVIIGFILILLVIEHMNGARGDTHKWP